MYKLLIVDDEEIEREGMAHFIPWEEQGIQLVGYVTRMMDENDVAWQIGELGRLDLGGGGTIAKYVANRGIKVLDMGVPVLSMHSPFEVIHKTDLYMAYRTFSVFCQSAD